jgi:hypothetical protein
MRETTYSPAVLGRRRSASSDAPLALRVKVSVTRGRLDRQIVSKWPCRLTPGLALRARQLIDPRNRRRLARNLRGIVEWVDHLGSGPNFSAVVIERAAVRSGREAILGLAERLDGTAPVCPRGVVFVHTLLTDCCVSPLFNRYCRQTVTEAVWEVADALEVEPPTVEFDAFAG